MVQLVIQAWDRTTFTLQGIGPHRKLVTSSPYERSKTLEEKAAWDFIKELPEDKKLELVAMNPGGILGPIPTKSCLYIGWIYRARLAGEVPGYVDLSVPMIYTHNVAQAHIVAMVH